MGNFLKIAEVSNPGNFLGNRLKVQIVTDARAMSPFESEATEWDSRIGIGGVLVVNEAVVEFLSLEVGDRIPHG